MPFAVVVGDQPAYTLLVEIKSEHPQEYEKIIPFLGPFHTQGCMIYAIYKRHKGSGIAEVLVAAGVIQWIRPEEGSTIGGPYAAFR